MTHPQPPFIDFRLTQSSLPTTQNLTLAESPTYPAYHITLHDTGKGIRPSSLHDHPDVSISHANYLASSFATAVFHRYRNSIGVTYPQTGLRRAEGDVTTTVPGDNVLPEVKQVVECENLGERRFGVEMDVRNGEGAQMEDYLWARPPRDEDRVHMLELKARSEESEEGEGPIAKVLMKNWDAVKRDELIAVVRVREDMFLNREEREDRRKGSDQILVTAVVLLERLRRRHHYLSSGSTWLSYC